MKIAAGLGVDKSDHVLIRHISERCFGVLFRLVSVGVKEPVVVGIFVVVASDLLLLRAFWVDLDMRMK